MRFIVVDNKTYQRFPIKTHLIHFREDLFAVVKRYAEPKFLLGDWIALSEKVVSICQNKVRHISTVKASWLAKLITKGVKKYPNDIGFSLPEKMQVAIDISGQGRMIFAFIFGAIGKIFGIHGLFWVLAGNRVAEIDGFNPVAMYPYNEYAVLPPEDPGKVRQEIEDKLGFPSTIIDGNNINVKVISKSRNLPLDKRLIRLILLDNPMGQDDELTPIIIIREAKNKKM